MVDLPGLWVRFLRPDGMYYSPKCKLEPLPEDLRQRVHEFG